MSVRTIRAKGKVTASAGRFGPRYGRFVRKRVIEIEKVSRAVHRCPQCDMVAVKRVGTGIWLCRKCGYKFCRWLTSPRPRSFVLHFGQSNALSSRARNEPLCLDLINAPAASARWRLKRITRINSGSGVYTAGITSSSRNVAEQLKP